MECNRDEAIRAKEIAEGKFKAKDIVSAKKFALKAHTLFPGLEGSSQMLATFEVYHAGESKVSGETDWYAVLNVSSTADDETVKKQYRKLALLLHPDKNKSIGADGAFRLVSEAWSVLSDKARRLAYDQKRNITRQHQKVSQQSRSQSAMDAQTAASKMIPPKRPVPTMPCPPEQHTFLTACPRCKMQFRYPLLQLNRTLVCPLCKEAFLAVEKKTSSTPGSCSFPQHQKNVDHVPTNKNAYVPGRDASGAPKLGTAFNRHGLSVDSFNHMPFQKGPTSTTTGVASTTASSETSNVGHVPTNNNAYVPGRDVSGAPKLGTAGYPHGPSVDSFNRMPFQKGPNSTTTGAASVDSFNRMPFQKGPTSKTTGVASTTASSETSNVIHHAYQKVWKENQDAVQKNFTSRRVSSGSFWSNPNPASSLNAFDREHSSTTVERPAKKQRCPDDSGGHISRGSLLEAVRGIERTPTGFKEPTTTAKERIDKSSSSPFDTRTMLMEKAKMEIRKKLNEWSLAHAAKATKGKEKESVTECDPSKLDESVSEKEKVLPKVSPSNPSTLADKEDSEPLSFDVPDPDFHDFDKDRMEQSFEGNQVWAAYDDDDGMPRFYALIQKVISLHPFKMRISWLNSKTNTELGPMNWVSSGFPKTCGEFRVGRYETRNTVNIFSHRVRWEKGMRGIITIFPMKGSVWALYRNWSPDWNETTPDELIHKYDMVVVLNDYSDDQGVSVAPLVKVEGFRTVFRRHTNPTQVRKIPKEEMFRLSHQVPSWLLTGEEAKNVPTGCVELDPAATPLELLKVMTGINEASAVGTSEKSVT